jgi:hypothetical protein
MRIEPSRHMTQPDAADRAPFDIQRQVTQTATGYSSEEIS